MNRSSKNTDCRDPSYYIRKMEEGLARDPDDAELHLRLAYLYETVRNDDRKAKSHYLQHLVLTLGHSDVATALSSLRESLSRDGGNHMAHIHIGLIHAYRNEFDEAVVELKEGTVWETHELPRYRLNVVPGSTAEREITHIIEERGRAFDEILALFELPPSRLEPIVYYFYESRVHKALLTGDQMPAHALTTKGEIHAVYGPEFKIRGLHEDVHILLRCLGRPWKLLEEGAALYADSKGGTGLFDAHISPWVAPGVVTSLIDDEAFTGSDKTRSYPVAASFVGFLIDNYGVVPFKEIYACRNSGSGESFRRVYGRSLEELEAAWLATLSDGGSRRG